MQFAEKNITAFAMLISSKPHRFSDAARSELTQLLQSHGDDAEGLSEAILEWCEDNALVEELARIRVTLPPSASARLAKDNPPPQEAGKKNSIKLLENAIQNKEPPTPDGEPSPTPSDSDDRKNDQAG
jgi:hypothetical protein